MDKLLNVPPLSDQEVAQLRNLLMRYLAYHTAGAVNIAIDKLIAKFKRTEIIDVTPSQKMRRSR